MKLKLASYVSQVEAWPKSGKHILSQFDNETIIVYQAYNPEIAREIVKNQTFHSPTCLEAGFKLTRTTWIKTNFLWMMYRSNWAQSRHQERILSFKITRKGFEEILSKAAVSRKGNSEAIKESDVVLQWDPDHKPDGVKVPERRAIQLGIRGHMLEKFSKEFIIEVCDITEFVSEQRENVKGDFRDLIVPVEDTYLIDDKSISDRIELFKSRT